MANEEAPKGLNFFQRHTGELILAATAVVTGAAGVGGVILTSARIDQARGEQNVLNATSQVEGADQVRRDELAREIRTDLSIYVPIEVGLFFASASAGVYALKKYRGE